MTNREQILEKMGDSLIACQVIEKVDYYGQQDWCIVYKFNGKIYHDFDDAYKAVKEWLDEEYEEEKEPTRTVRVKVDFSEGYEKYKNSDN